MNEKQPYEILITEKLQAIPVPDMVDMIWARIEEKLDTDMPTDDGDNPAPAGPPPVTKFIIGAGITAVVVALLTLFLNPEKKSAITPTHPTNTLPPTISEPSKPAPSQSPPLNPRNQSILPAPTDSNRLTAADFIDSIVSSPAVQLPTAVADSTSRNVPAIVLPPVQSQPQQKDSIKKPRGVQGISDDDYRIEPKRKDSI